MTLKLHLNVNILKTYLRTENEVGRSSQAKVIAQLSIFQGQLSNVTNFQPLLAFTISHIPTDLNRFVTSCY